MKTTITLLLTILTINATAQSNYTQTEAYTAYRKANDVLGWHCDLSEKESQKQNAILKQNLQEVTTDYCTEKHIVVPKTEAQQWFIANLMMNDGLNFTDTKLNGALHLTDFGKDTMIISKNALNENYFPFVNIDKQRIAWSNNGACKQVDRIIGYYHNTDFYMAYFNLATKTLDCYWYRIEDFYTEKDSYTLTKIKL